MINNIIMFVSGAFKKHISKINGERKQTSPKLLRHPDFVQHSLYSANEVDFILQWSCWPLQDLFSSICCHCCGNQLLWPIVPLWDWLSVNAKREQWLTKQPLNAWYGPRYSHRRAQRWKMLFEASRNREKFIKWSPRYEVKQGRMNNNKTQKWYRNEEEA